MANDWGRPFTPEELEKLANKRSEPNLTRALETIMHPDFGKTATFVHRQELVPQITDPTPGDELHYTGPNLAFQVPPTDPTPATIDSTPEELAAKGWVQTAHDEWEKIAPDTSPFAGSKVTMKRVDADFDMLIVDEAHIETPWTGLGGENPTCYAWHPESGCGIIFSDRDALNEALEAEPLLVEMTKEEYDAATKVRAADWGSEPAFVGGTMTGRKDWSIPDINGDEWPTHPDQLSPMTVEQQQPEPRTAPVDTFSEADGPWYVVYFGPVLYTVLAGPYDTQEAAEERIPIVWGQFEHDAAYDFSFPQRERSGLRATTVRSVFNLKGAYGKQ